MKQIIPSIYQDCASSVFISQHATKWKYTLYSISVDSYLYVQHYSKITAVPVLAIKVYGTDWRYSSTHS